jgi:hypothetical protein
MLVPSVTITARGLRREGGKAMVMLRCPCEQGSDVWGELWWTGNGHRWVFFDDDKRSDTYATEVERCPACDRRLEREGMAKAKFRDRAAS